MSLKDEALATAKRLDLPQTLTIYNKKGKAFLNITDMRQFLASTALQAASKNETVSRPAIRLLVAVGRRYKT